MAQLVKNLPASAGDARDVVWTLGWEDPLEKEMETHSTVLSWKIPWTEAPGGLQSLGSRRVRHDWEFMQMTLVVGLSYMAFIMLKCISSTLNLLTFFLSCMDTELYKILCICCRFLSFTVLMWYIIFIDLSALKHLCIHLIMWYYPFNVLLNSVC